MSLQNEIDRMKKQLEEENNKHVNVALFGQPGAGKSSIINKLVGEKVAEVGVVTDTTKELKKYEWKGLILGDLPGYDTKAFPKANFFEKFKIPMFDLFLCVFDGKFHQPDSEFFSELVNINKTCIFIRNKRDNIYEDGKETQTLENEIKVDVQKHIKAEPTLIFTSVRDNYGFDELQKSIFYNLDDAKREKWARNAKAYSQEFLDKKKAACEKYIATAAGLSSVNALNPVPGVDITVDLGILIVLFKQIREAYGLTDEKLTMYEKVAGGVAPLAKNILAWSTREGIIILLKRVAGRATVKQCMKYVPIVGQIIAASIGFAIVMYAGNTFLDECHEIATNLLRAELGEKR